MSVGLKTNFAYFRHLIISSTDKLDVIKVTCFGSPLLVLAWASHPHRIRLMNTRARLSIQIRTCFPSL